MFEQFIGTKPVEERHRIDVASLESYLKLKILQLEQFKGGQSNPTYRITASDQKKYVLRRKPPGKLLPSAHAVEREYKVIKALHGAGFPVAKPYVLCEDDSVIGTAFYVMDCVEGRVLWDQSLPGMSKAERFAIWDELNRVIAALHVIDYRSVGLEDFGKPGNYIGRQVARWTKQYQASETERVEAMDNLIAWLRTNIRPETGTTVGHGDFRLDHAIFHAGEQRELRLHAEGAGAEEAAHRFHGRAHLPERVQIQRARAQRQALDASPRHRRVEAHGEKGGVVEPLPAALQARARGAVEPRICAALRNHGSRELGARGVQLLGARYRQHGDHRALPQRGPEEGMAGTAAARREPLRLPHDRA